MKTMRLFFLFVFFSASLGSIKAQKVQFTYDAAGNRIVSKTISMLRSDVPEEAEEELPTGYSEVLADRVVRIYPNPTKGLIRIELENLQKGEKAQIQLYDLSGKSIIGKYNVTNQTEMDITSQPDGVYILIVAIGEYKTEWKVIKQ